MNLIGQSAVICLSFSGLCRMLLQLQYYQKTKQFKKCPIVVPQAQTLLTSLIILVDLTMLILSDKLLLDIQLMHTFMPNMIHKPWMVSTVHSWAQPNNKHIQHLKKNLLFCKVQFWWVKFDWTSEHFDVFSIVGTRQSESKKKHTN